MTWWWHWSNGGFYSKQTTFVVGRNVKCLNSSAPDEFSKEKPARCLESTRISLTIMLLVCVRIFSPRVCELMRMVQSKQVCACTPQWRVHCTSLCANASLWLWMNNSESWHSWVEPLLFMVGIGTNRWLLLILRTSRHSHPPRNQAVFNTFMSVSILYPVSSPPLCISHTPLFLCPCSPDLCPLHLWASLSLPRCLCIFCISFYISPCLCLSVSCCFYRSVPINSSAVNFLGTRCLLLKC